MAVRRSKRPDVPVAMPGQRGMRPFGVIDARTHVEHRVSDVAHCAATVLAASLTEPGHVRCAECAR